MGGGVAVLGWRASRRQHLGDACRSRIERGQVWTRRHE